MLSRVFLVFLLMLSCAGAKAYDYDWPYRTLATVSKTGGRDVAGELIRINLNAASFSANYNWSVDGADLRLTEDDQETELPFQIESWNQSAKTATLVFQAPNDVAVWSTSFQIYLFYGNATATSQSQNILEDLADGILWHTRYTTGDPGSRQEALTLFNAANDSNSQYGRTLLSSFTNVTNYSAVGGATTNYVLFSESTFTVPVGNGGNWTFRAGVDLGYGAGLYLDGVALDEMWDQGGTDIWWGGSFNNYQQNPGVFWGTVNLSVGQHTLILLGVEPSNGGVSTIQFRRGTGSWQAYSTANLDIV